MTLAAAAVITIASNSAMAGTKKIWDGPAFGCINKDYAETMAGALSQGDDVAFRKGMMDGILTGVCTMFEAGDDVYLTDTAIFSGMVEVRKKGDTQEYWTMFDMVIDPNKS